jgi:hypothetical protein
MRIIITETQLKNLIKENVKLGDILNEQSFYPSGCRPTYKDSHGFESDNTSVKRIKNDFKYSTSNYWIKKLLGQYQKQAKSDREYKNAKDDLINSMDNDSRMIYEKLDSENHPLFYGLPALFANNAKSAVGSYVPSGYGSAGAKRVTEFDIKLKNWVTKLVDVGNGDYSWTFEFDRVMKTKNIN